MQKILVKALQSDVKDRYQDVVDFIMAVSGYLNSDAFEKDKVVKDHLSELSESLRQSQSLLTPLKAPQWEKLHLEVATSNSRTLSGIYYDFLELNSNQYAIVFGEPSIRGADGLLFSSLFCGMFRGVYKIKTNPQDLVQELNQNLSKEEGSKSFNLNLLIIDKTNLLLTYIICGQSYLWKKNKQNNLWEKINSPNPALGLDSQSKFQIQVMNLGEGDSCLLCNITDEMPNNELAEILNSSQKSIAAVWMESFHRKMKLLNKKVTDKTISFLSITIL